jgi:SNF2 family DNA or RNA helicase
VHLKILENGKIIEKVCPAPHCGREISAENLLFTDVLKFCLWPNLESEAPTSHPIDVHRPFSVCESSCISSKIRNTIDILNSIIINTEDADDTMGSVPSESTPAKAIVFTQWTGMLDLLERSLNSNHIEFRRLDGSMPLNVRERAVKEFNTEPEVIFLECYHFSYFHC